MAQDMFNKFLNKTNTGLEFIAALMESLKKYVENEGAQKIVEHFEKEKDCEAWTCDPSVVKMIDARLTEAGVDHAFVQYPGNDDKSPIFLLTKAEDREKVEHEKAQCLNELKVVSNLTLDELKRENADGTIRTIAGLSQTRAEVFREEAKRAGMATAITDNKDGTFNVHYSGKDETEAKSVIVKTIESTVGETGKYNEQRIADSINDGYDIHNAVLNTQEDMYIVSASQPNEYMHFSSEGFEHYRNERLIGDELRSNRNYQQDAHSRINASFVQPVVMSKEEYERVREMPKDKRKEEIEKHRAKHHKVTKLTTRDAHCLELERKARELRLAYEMKLSLENNPLNTNFADPSISFNAFLNHESVTDARVENETERGNEMSINAKELTFDTHALVNEYVELPKEDQEYINDYVKEYYREVRELTIETEEITREDLNVDLDAVVAGLTEEKTTTRETETEEREF